MGEVIKKSPEKFYFTVFVGLGDTNLEGNVYWTNYFVWFGKAREVFLMHICPDFLQLFATGTRILTHETYVKHFSSSYFADEITLEITTGEIRNASAKLFVSFTRKNTGEKIAEGWQTLVFADQEGKPAHVPQMLKEAALKYARSRRNSE